MTSGDALTVSKKHSSPIQQSSGGSLQFGREKPANSESPRAEVRLFDSRGENSARWYPLSDYRTPTTADDTEIGQRGSDLPKQLFEALEKHPNIFEAKPPTSWEYLSSRGGPFGIIIDGPIFSFRVHLPKAQHKYQDMDCVEHFSVISNGSIYAAFAQVRDIPFWANIGHEYRELARAQIEKSTPYKSPILGPCPIHPDVYIVFVEPDQTDPSRKPRIYSYEGNIFIVVADKPADEFTTVLDTFIELESAIQDFYTLQMSRDVLIDYDIETANHFGGIADSVSGLIETAAWRFWKRQAFSKQAKSSLAAIQVHLVDFEQELASHGRLKNRFIVDIRKHSILSTASEYFDEMTQAGSEIPTTLGPALQFFEGEFQLYRNARSLLIASLLGGIVGALLTGLITLFH